MRVTRITLLTCLLLVLAGVSMAQQMDQQQLRVTVQTGPVVRRGLPPSADVFVGGRFALRIPASAGGMTPMQRARIIAERLNQAFQEGLSWQNTRVSQVGGLWAVVIDSRMIATADVRSARAFGISTGALANRWARQTVVAMGGQPQMIAQQLQPIPVQVAGAREEIGQINWATSPTKTVPLLNAATGDRIGTVTIAGPSDRLNMANAVAVFEYTSDGATVRSFVPITGTLVTSQLTRAHGVGLVSMPSETIPLQGLRMGMDVMNMVTRMGTQWNAQINTRLTQQNLQVRTNTKVVPLYSMDQQQIVGAAQVVGTARGIGQTQAVIVSSRDGLMQFSATPAQCPPMGTPAVLNDVVVTSLIVFPEEGMSPGAMQPGATQPAPSMTAPPPESPAAPPGTSYETPSTPGETEEEMHH